MPLLVLMQSHLVTLKVVMKCDSLTILTHVLFHR